MTTFIHFLSSTSKRRFENLDILFLFCQSSSYFELSNVVHVFPIHLFFVFLIYFLTTVSPIYITVGIDRSFFILPWLENSRLEISKNLK